MPTQINVTVVWMDNNEQVGARLSFNGSADRPIDLSMDDIRKNYAHKLANADITPDGLQPKPGFTLDYKQYILNITYLDREKQNNDEEIIVPPAR